MKFFYATWSPLKKSSPGSPIPPPPQFGKNREIWKIDVCTKFFIFGQNFSKKFPFQEKTSPSLANDVDTLMVTWPPPPSKLKKSTINGTNQNQWYFFCWKFLIIDKSSSTKSIFQKKRCWAPNDVGSLIWSPPPLKFDKNQKRSKINVCRYKIFKKNSILGKITLNNYLFKKTFPWAPKLCWSLYAKHLKGQNVKNKKNLNPIFFSIIRGPPRIIFFRHKSGFLRFGLDFQSELFKRVIFGPKIYKKKIPKMVEKRN